MKPTALKTLIITCWAVLVLCLVIKLLGGNWFELATENTKFIQFCEFVDNTMWLKMSLACLIYCVSGYFILCVIMNTKKLTLIQLSIFMLLMIFKSIINWYYTTIGTITDICILTLVPLLLSKFKSWKRVLIGFALINAFQIISILIRNIGFGNFNNNTTLFSMLMQVDYYIMVALMYLYNIQLLKRKETT